VLIALIAFLICVCCALGALSYRLWTAHWGLISDVEEAAEKLESCASAIETLAQRDVLSNDATVVLFLKHIRTAVKTVNGISDRWNSSDDTDD